jgi:hypothetical protein
MLCHPVLFCAMLCCEQKLNFFGGPSLTTEAEARLELDKVDHGEDRIVFLANVWLDRSETFEALRTLLSGTCHSAASSARFGKVKFMQGFHVRWPGLTSSCTVARLSTRLGCCRQPCI